ncbi:MAG TPA: serine hydrolase domain-containing protein [Vicinamibacterales bacterium]|nr:serine hydrolase domain-containing protein [Vicinamibacterales bacterium]
MTARTFVGRRAVLVGAIVAVALSLGATQPGAQSSAASNPLHDPEVLGAERLFTAWIEGQIAFKGYPGVAVGVVSDQRLVWARGFGMADIAGKVPMTPQTKIRMASHSKLFTATAIMQLREQGKLNLDDPVAKHLPWFAVTAAGEDDAPITIVELLTHSSGLPREAADHWTTLEFPTRDALRALIPKRQAAFAPETRWKYSNLAYTVAGMVVEEVSGASWADYVTRHIFMPLGMNDSSVDRNVPGLAVGYGRRMPDGSRTPMPFVDARGMAAATGVTSTVEDMARFVSAQFRHGKAGGDRILSTASLREMHRVRMLENTWTRGSGIGFAVSRNRDKLFVGHGGGYPGYITNTLIQLDAKVGVIVLTNAQDGDASGIATQLMNTVGEAVAKAAAADKPKITWDPSWSRYAGLYRGRGGDSHVVELHEKLVIINPEAANLDNPIQLEPLGDGTFRYVAPVGGGPVGEIVRFVEEGGRVVRMITGDSYVERVRN